MATKPTIDITFKQLATTLIQRSERGTAILLLNDSTLATDRVYDWDNTTGVNTLSANVTGSTATSGTGFETITLGDITYTSAIKMDANTNISFTIANKGTMTVLTSASDSVTTPTITIDDKEYEVKKKENTEIEISEGTHTITKGTNTTYLYAVSVKISGTDGLVTNVYKSVEDIDEEIYTDKNLQYIKNCLAYAPYDVVVISGSSTKFSDFAPYIKAAKDTGWIAFAGEKTPQPDLASWIKSMENQGLTYKAIGTVSGTDCKQYVYFEQAVTDNSGDELTALDYLPSLLGILASCNITRGCTNYLCTDLSEVTEVDDVDEAVSNGQLVLSNDTDGVRIVSGINSLVTLNGNTATEDMQYIETVEAMNLIRDDIKTEFKNTYQGAFKNKYKYQMLFIGAVNEYLRSLANEDVIDDGYDNFAKIDVEAQRSAWIGTGKSEAEDWTDDKVKSMSFKRSVFIACDIKILNCMENLKFTVTME